MLTSVLLQSSPDSSLGVVLAAIVVVIALYSSVEIVDVQEKRALTVFGRYRRLLGPGVNLVPPFVSKTYSVDVGEQMLAFPEEIAITRDDFVVTVDLAVFISVTDAKKVALEVSDYESKISILTSTTLRTVLGEMDSDDVLGERREFLNTRLRLALDDSTTDWGVKVVRVDIRETNPQAGSQ